MSIWQRVKNLWKLSAISLSGIGTEQSLVENLKRKLHPQAKIIEVENILDKIEI